LCKFTVTQKLLVAGRVSTSMKSARVLFSELTPARIDLLDTLRRMGPSSMYALAKVAERNYSNVHTDVVRLLELGLVERGEEGMVFVLFDAMTYARS
jgi:predicted transcriptional regulator